MPPRASQRQRDELHLGTKPERGTGDAAPPRGACRDRSARDTRQPGMPGPRRRDGTRGPTRTRDCRRPAAPTHARFRPRAAAGSRDDPIRSAAQVRPCIALRIAALQRTRTARQHRPSPRTSSHVPVRCVLRLWCRGSLGRQSTYTVYKPQPRSASMLVAHHCSRAPAPAPAPPPAPRAQVESAHLHTPCPEHSHDPTARPSRPSKAGSPPPRRRRPAAASRAAALGA